METAAATPCCINDFIILKPPFTTALAKSLNEPIPFSNSFAKTPMPDDIAELIFTEAKPNSFIFNPNDSISVLKATIAGIGGINLDVASFSANVLSFNLSLLAVEVSNFADSKSKVGSIFVMPIDSVVIADTGLEATPPPPGVLVLVLVFIISSTSTAFGAAVNKLLNLPDKLSTVSPIVLNSAATTFCSS